MAQTKKQNRRCRKIKPCPHDEQGKKEIVMFNFLTAISKIFACLVIVVVPVIQALVTALDNYDKKEVAYAAM